MVGIFLSCMEKAGPGARSRPGTARDLTATSRWVCGKSQSSLCWCYHAQGSHFVGRGRVGGGMLAMCSYTSLAQIPTPKRVVRRAGRLGCFGLLDTVSSESGLGPKQMVQGQREGAWQALVTQLTSMTAAAVKGF